MSPQARHIRQAAGDVLEGKLRSLPADCSEARFQAAVRRYASELGYLVLCTYDSRRSPSGAPDLQLIHPRRNVYLQAELKSHTGRLSKAQQIVIMALRRAGVKVYVWKPSDWPEIVEVLRES